MARIGLIAGAGKLPIVFAQAARQKGDTVIAFGIKGITSDDLAASVDRMHWLDWGALQKALLLLATERIRRIILLGKLNKETVFKEKGAFDDKAKALMDKMKDKKDYAILNEVTSFLKKLGVEVIDSTTYLKEFIPTPGVLTKRAPSDREQSDIDYGAGVARTIAGFDIGQTLVVKDKTVIAVEAMEGTDETITRSGPLVNGSFVVIKVARPDQDMRFDVPLVGIATLRALTKAGGTALALESGKTLLMDRAEVVKFADANGIAITII